MLQLKKIIREDNFLSLSGNLIIAILGFGGFALLARSLNPDDFAKWVLFISGGSLVEMLRYGITNNGLVRFLSGATKNQQEHLIGSNVFISALVTLVIVAIMSISYLVFNDVITNSAYEVFFKWYPILAFFEFTI